MLEIERSWLVRQLPDLSKYSSEKIQQGYISGPRQPLRIRSKGEKYELTKKIRPDEKDLTTAEEITIPLTKDEFTKLWALVKRYLTKTRYYIPLESGLAAELDIFSDKLEGLSMIEVEFVSKESMNSFVPPDWFGADVTDEPFSSSAFLAGKSYEEIADLIARF